jgi:hypothetical protein
MKTLIQTRQTRKLSAFIIVALLACLTPLPNAQAVSPPPDGGYPGGNTAEGYLALGGLTTGSYNSAVGIYSLLSLTDGSFNTGVGAGTLLLNTADSNTAIGAGALLSNTTGSQNTATGAFALFSNTTGAVNTGVGYQALFSNTTGDDNTATGRNALVNNTTGSSNTAIGVSALFHNTIASTNTAIGDTALFSNTTGTANTATGFGALLGNTTGESNTANGYLALNSNTTGSNNTALGLGAGYNITGDGNVCIGAGVNGVAGENNITRIRNVYESVATERAVYVTSDNRIGTLSSSRRYKEQIKPMEKAIETIHSLRPVSFRYKKEIDPAQPLCFGLIAEEVADVNPNLVTLDCEGKPETVRYEAINAMLLSEFLKQHKVFLEEHHKVEKLEAIVSRQQKQIEALAAGLEKVSNQLGLSKAGSRTVANNP